MSGSSTSAIQQQYRTDGFFIAPEPILPPDIVQAAVAGMDAVREGRYDAGQPPQPSRWNPGDDPNELCKIELPQQADLGIRALVSHPDLGRWAARVTGARMVQVWWTQLLYKPPQPEEGEAELNIGWHQDRHYWRAWDEGSELFTAWVALSDVTAEAGPMRFVRGSHGWGLLDDGGFYRQDLDDQRDAIPVPDGRSWEEVPALLPAGAPASTTASPSTAADPTSRPAPGAAWPSTCARSARPRWTAAAPVSPPSSTTRSGTPSSTGRHHETCPLHVEGHSPRTRRHSWAARHRMGRNRQALLDDGGHHHASGPGWPASGP